jgi:hypothetical protein
MAYKVHQSNPAAATPDDLYVVPASKQGVISTLSVSEHGGEASVFSILIRPNGDAAAPVHTFVNAGQLLANESQFFTLGLALGENDVITVEANKAGVTFMCFVNETVVA